MNHQGRKSTWPAQHLEYLVVHAGVVHAKEIAFALGRSHNAVSQMATKKLGLSLRVRAGRYKRPPERKYW